MAWETRARGGLYYTRSVRRNGRVHREYFGVGPVAEAIAALDALEHDKRLAERRSLMADRQADAIVEAAIVEVDHIIETLTRLELVCAGFHRHHRGPWRKRRAQKS
jgi:hypothetical protein